MSDNEYEKFEINDYDYENEFNPNRPRRKLTKNQQIYGIWADDSDNDSDNADTSRRGGRRGRGERKTKDYTAPVSFVAGGVQQSGKSKGEEEKKDEDDQITDEEDERPSFGRKQPQLLAADANDSSEESAEEAVSAPTMKRSSFQPTAGTKNLGAWEKHTRGIGAKLLLQMGYKPGKGLGKDLQGISQPVEAHVRKGRGAIGAYGPEKPATIGGKSAKEAVEEEKKEALEHTEKRNKWKRNDEGRADKTKRYYYRSVEEIIEKGQKNSNILSTKLSKKLTNVPVIDMTGPEKRVLSGYHAIAHTKMQEEDLYDNTTTEDAPKQVYFALPELLHNIQLIVNMCEQEIISLDQTEREATEKKEAFEHECKHMEHVIQLEENHISTLEKAFILVEELINGGDNNMSLERAEKIFLKLQQDYAAEYEEYHIADLAASVVANLIKQLLAGWQPLKQPKRHVDTIKRWRTILDITNSKVQQPVVDENARNVFDPYSSLIWAGVIPYFRSCATEWNPKQHQPMAELLDSWAPVFPNWILDTVLEQMVLSRICTGVRDWDPLTDTVPIHIWIIPWQSILGKKMEEFVFPTIREKLGVALQAWMPHDRSARAMLSPWKGAFDEAQMQLFLLTHIIPKLQLVLNEFIINPLQQDLELWNQVWEWHEVIPAILMAQLLDKYFFPKWMQVLALWLNQSPDFGEISRWYTGWKQLFNEQLLREPNIKEHFRRALEMMHRATETLVTATNSFTGLPTMATGTTPTPPPPPQMTGAYIDLQLPQPAQLEFKELVSQKCADRGILFVPLPGRREMGKQIYRVGKLYCYIDRNVCMLSDSSLQNWAPTSLAQLLDRATIGFI